MSAETLDIPEEEGKDKGAKAAFSFDQENKAAATEPPQPSELTEGTIELGRWVKDRVSGFQGVATTINLHLSEMVQISIQPQMKPGATELPESLSFDIQNVVYAEPPEGWERPAHREPTIETWDMEFELGNKVKDIVSKIEGIATQFAIMLNGCIYVVIDPPQDKANRNIIQKTHHFVDWSRVKYVDEGIARKMEKKMSRIFEDNPEATRGPGGPVTKAFRAGAR